MCCVARVAPPVRCVTRDLDLAFYFVALTALATPTCLLCRPGVCYVAVPSVGVSRATDPDGDAGSDLGGWDEYDPALTPDAAMGRLNDEFEAALGGRSAIRNAMVRSDLHLRSASTAKKPKTYVADAFRRTAVGMQRVDVGEHSTAPTNRFCRRNCPFGRACHLRVTTPVCMACFDVARSGERAAVKAAGPPVVMNPGFSTQRGTFVFKLHWTAYLSGVSSNGNLLYDPCAILQQEGVAVPGMRVSLLQPWQAPNLHLLGRRQGPMCVLLFCCSLARGARASVGRGLRLTSHRSLFFGEVASSTSTSRGTLFSSRRTA